MESGEQGQEPQAEEYGLYRNMLGLIADLDEQMVRLKSNYQPLIERACDDDIRAELTASRDRQVDANLERRRIFERARDLALDWEVEWAAEIERTGHPMQLHDPRWERFHQEIREIIASGPEHQDHPASE